MDRPTHVVPCYPVLRCVVSFHCYLNRAMTLSRDVVCWGLQGLDFDTFVDELDDKEMEGALAVGAACSPTCVPMFVT